MLLHEEADRILFANIALIAVLLHLPGTQEQMSSRMSCMAADLVLLVVLKRQNHSTNTPAIHNNILDRFDHLNADQLCCGCFWLWAKCETADVRQWCLRHGTL